jgi:hypothetical protein
MKTLSTDASAAALGVDRKTLDNVLAREGRLLVKPGSRGRSRRIPIDALMTIAVALILSRDLGVGIARGLELADLLIGSPASSVSLGSLSTLSFDVPRLRAMLDHSIDEALESVAEPIRGRPRL